MQMFQSKFQTLTRQNLLQVSRSKETQNTVKVLYIVLVLVLLLQNNCNGTWLRYSKFKISSKKQKIILCFPLNHFQTEYIDV